MVLIDSLSAKQILNGRGEPTLEVSVLLSNGTTASAASPSGVTKSVNEAIELLDKDFSKYSGHSVEHAIDNVNKTISPRLKKLDPTEHFKIDQILMELDNTPNRAHLGANTLYAVSMAIAQAAAQTKGIKLYRQLNDLFLKVEARNRYEERIVLPEAITNSQLPIPAISVINGGSHADTNLTIEDLLVFPVGQERMAEKIRAGVEIQNQVKRVLNTRKRYVNVGDSGGYVSEFESPLEAFEVLVEAVHNTRYHIENQVLYGIDVGSVETPPNFFDDVLSKYPLVSIEDPYPDGEIAKYAELNKKYVDLFVVSDNLTATHIKPLYQAIEQEAIDAVSIKPSQVGTLTEVLAFAKVAKEANLAIFMTARAGETNDAHLTDLAVGIGAKFLDAGGVMRGERVAKYNRLLELAEYFETPL